VTVTEKADRLRRQGFDPVLVRPDGCPRRRGPHVCANCAVGVLWVATPTEGDR